MYFFTRLLPLHPVGPLRSACLELLRSMSRGVVPRWKSPSASTESARHLRAKGRSSEQHAEGVLCFPHERDDGAGGPVGPTSTRAQLSLAPRFLLDRERR